MSSDDTRRDQAETSEEPDPTPEPSSDEIDREAILARRRFFVASAVAGVVLGGASCDSGPFFPCLKVAADAAPTEGADAQAAEQEDAGAPVADAALPPTATSPPSAADAGSADAGRDAAAAGTDAGPDAAVPGPCLRAPAPSGKKPVPAPCLLILPPKKE